MKEPITDQELREHFKNDSDFQKEIRDHFKKMEPMFKAFEDNEVIKIGFQNRTKTLVFYVSSISVVATALYGVWYFIKTVILKVP